MVEEFNPGTGGDGAQLAGCKTTNLRSDGCLALTSSALEPFLKHAATASSAAALQAEHARVYHAKQSPRLQVMDMATFLSKDAENTLAEVACMHITTRSMYKLTHAWMSKGDTEGGSDGTLKDIHKGKGRGGEGKWVRRRSLPFGPRLRPRSPWLPCPPVDPLNPPGRAPTDPHQSGADGTRHMNPPTRCLSRRRPPSPASRRRRMSC